MNRTLVVIFSILSITILVIGGYFFWDITRPIQPSEISPTRSEDISLLPPPPENKTIKTQPNTPLWKDPTPETSTDPKPIPQPKPETNKITIPNTQDNSNTSVKNFYQNTATRLLNEKKDVVLKEDTNYYIDYLAAGQSFGISLTGDNLQTSRIAGEQDLLKILGITEYQACKLNVSVTVPGSVNENAAGIDYHLSFCPDGIPLP